MLTEAQFRSLFPNCPAGKRGVYLPLLVAAMQEFAITSRARVCAFLAQIGHETSDLKFQQEIWGPTAAQKRYDTRTNLGNTPEVDGDGFKYRGRGAIQLTGAANYRTAGKALGLDLFGNPDRADDPDVTFRIAGHYWQRHNLNALADRLTLKGDGPDLIKFDKITKVINGGQNGREDRRRRYQKARGVISTADFLHGAFQLPDASETRPATSAKATEAVPTPTAAAGDPVATAPGTDKTLLAKVSASEAARTAGKSMAKKVGFRLGGPLAVLGAALQAGNVYAWLGVAVVVIAVIALVVVKRRQIKSGLGWLVKKAKG